MPLITLPSSAWRPAASVLVGLLLVVACGGKEPAPQSQSAPQPPTLAPAVNATPDPCALLSTEDLQAIAAIAAEAHSSSSGGARVCTWTDVNGKSVIVQIYPTAAGYEASRAAFESFYSATAENVGEVGDAACYIAGKTASVPTATFCMRKGGSSASVQVMAVTEGIDVLKPQALALARKVAEKL